MSTRESSCPSVFFFCSSSQPGPFATSKVPPQRPGRAEGLQAERQPGGRCVWPKVRAAQGLRAHLRDPSRRGHASAALTSWSSLLGTGSEVTVSGGLHLGAFRVPSELTEGSTGEGRKERWPLHTWFLYWLTGCFQNSRVVETFHSYNSCAHTLWANT